MKRIAFRAALTLFALAAALPAAAQGGHSLWIKGGVGIPSPSTSDDLITIAGSDGGSGFVGGIGWEGTFGKGWSLEMEVLYARREVSNSYAPFFEGGDGSKVTWDMQTLEVPVHAKLALARGATRPYLLGGWVTAIPLEVDQVGTAFGGFETVKDTYEFENVWLALEAGAGLEHGIGGSLSLALEARYVWGLNNVRKVESESIKLRDLRVFAGLKIGL